MDARPITLFEWVRYPIREGSVPGFVDGILVVPTGFFDILDECDPNSQIFSRTRKTLTPTRMVGVVRVGDVTIQILPKLFRNNLSQYRPVIARNLGVMLSYTDLGISRTDLASLDREDLDMLELFIRIFAEKLHTLLSRCQHRQYLQKSKELRYIKGRIDILNYWNPAKLDRIPCRFKELTQDTPLNRIFKYCATLMSGHIHSDQTREHLREIIRILDPVTLLPQTTSDARLITLDRFAVQFAPFLRFCELYLSHSTVSLRASRVEFFSLLIPMEKVFEMFIAGVLEENHHLLPSDSVILAQVPIGYLAQKQSGSEIFRLIPDIVVDHPRLPVIIDTKYKTRNVSDSKSGVQQSDMYQMFAYAAKRKVPALMLLYPDCGEKIDADWEFLYEYDRSSALLIRSVSLTFDLADPTQWDQWVRDFMGIIADLFQAASRFSQPMESGVKPVLTDEVQIISLL